MSKRVATPLLVVAAGTLLGLASRASDLLPRDLGWVGNLGGIWVGAAFIVGAVVAKPLRSALAGAGTLSLAALVHYGSYRLMRYGSPDLLRYPAPQWAATGAAVGGLMGAAASSWRHVNSRWRSIAVLTAALGAEALYLVLLAHSEPKAREIALPLEIAAFLILPFAVLTSAAHRARAVAWAWSAAPLGAAAIAMAERFARRIY